MQCYVKELAIVHSVNDTLKILHTPLLVHVCPSRRFKMEDSGSFSRLLGDPDTISYGKLLQFEKCNIFES